MVHAIMLLGILIVHDYCKYSIEAALNRPVLNPLFPDCVSERQSTWYDIVCKGAHVHESEPISLKPTLIMQKPYLQLLTD